MPFRTFPQLYLVKTAASVSYIPQMGSYLMSLKLFPEGLSEVLMLLNPPIYGFKNMTSNGQNDYLYKCVFAVTLENVV